MDELRNKLKELNESKDFNVSRFCRLAKVSRDTFYKFLEGKNTTVRTIGKLEAGLLKYEEKKVDNQSEQVLSCPPTELNIRGEGGVPIIVDVDSVLRTAKKIMQSNSPFAQILYDAICLVNKAAGIMEDVQSHPWLKGKENAG